MIASVFLETELCISARDQNSSRVRSELTYAVRRGWALRTFHRWRGLAIEPRMPPKLESNRERVDLDLIPPPGLVGVAMKRAVMDPTNRDGELVADPRQSAQACAGAPSHHRDSMDARALVVVLFST